ncbi:hypothetical protein CIHG_02791 [Coccidioides immitis H538.4]|uniref:Uncharacterized protein n=1 Tax=Coccidioides immitis H538.4 TaxID=396776 RepID=A0A0J8RJJ5_COCIT|nr:hypothetical protein CIHG_02791 [Coccidioides immitis H538.4]
MAESAGQVAAMSFLPSTDDNLGDGEMSNPASYGPSHAAMLDSIYSIGKGENAIQRCSQLVEENACFELIEIQRQVVAPSSELLLWFDESDLGVERIERIPQVH